MKLSELFVDYTALPASFFDQANWGVGNNLYVEQKENGDLALGANAPLVTINVATNDAELQAAKDFTFASVFDLWERVSIQGKNPHAKPEEENAWTYDQATGQIVCSVNSSTSIGFIGPERFDNYTFEVEVASTDGDDDAIGLILAYLENPDGTCSSLQLVRTGSTIAPYDVEPYSQTVLPFYLVYQGYRNDPDTPANFDPNAKVVGGVVGNLTFCDGTPVPATGIVTNGGYGGWSTMGPIRLKVERTPTTIRCWTSNRGSQTYEEANSFTVDLTSLPALRTFQQPAAIGFMAHSQMSSTYKALQIPGLQRPIIDVRTNTVWLYENDAWVSVPMDDDVCPFVPGQLVHSPQTKKLYFTNTNLTLIPVGHY